MSFRAIAILLASLFVSSAHGAVVTYVTDEITSSFDIQGGTAGLIQANNFLSTVYSGSPDIDIAGGTVTFNAINPGGSNGGFAPPTLTGDPDLNDLLSSSRFNTSSLTVTGLTPGEEYRLQVFGYAANFVHNTLVTVDGQTSGTWGIFSATPDSADRLTANWIQDVGETSVTIQFTSNPQVSGMILHSVTQEQAANAVPAPAAIGLLLTALGLRRRRRAA